MVLQKVYKLLQCRDQVFEPKMEIVVQTQEVFDEMGWGTQDVFGDEMNEPNPSRFASATTPAQLWRLAQRSQVAKNII